MPFAAAVALLLAAPPAVTAAPAPSAADPRRTLLEAMATELGRNHAELKLKENKPPYFISYQMKDYDQREVVARYGALFQDNALRDRKLYVDVRVGSHDFDNSV